MVLDWIFRTVVFEIRWRKTLKRKIARTASE